jgi:hypothetical protein
MHLVSFNFHNPLVNVLCIVSCYLVSNALFLIMLISIQISKHLKSLFSFLEHININIYKRKVFNPKRRSSLVTIDQHLLQQFKHKHILWIKVSLKKNKYAFTLFIRDVDMSNEDGLNLYNYACIFPSI